ncbi:MAG: nucleotidyltransferase domain-containing protein [Ruminococcus flavefaciens]|nr:nucleotidyltransferase domain-containing protein [Ruminococcus flavefaciens]
MAVSVYTRDELIGVILPLLKKYQAEGAILFGSYARQEATAQSDIDLVVIGGVRFDPTDVFCLADDLHCLTGKPVDVYEQREINAGTAFYDMIFSKGVRIA